MTTNRKPDGTFAPGNSLSDGRDKYARLHHLQSVFAASVTDSDIRKLMMKLVAMSLDGDLVAMKPLMSHLFTKPATPGTAVQINNNVASDADRASRVRAAIHQMMTEDRAKNPVASAALLPIPVAASVKAPRKRTVAKPKK